MGTESRFNVTYFSANVWRKLSRITNQKTFEKIVKDVSDLYKHVKNIKFNNQYEVEVYGIGNEYAQELEQQQKIMEEDTQSIKRIIERHGVNFIKDIISNKGDDK